MTSESAELCVGGKRSLSNRWQTEKQIVSTDNNNALHLEQLPTGKSGIQPAAMPSWSKRLRPWENTQRSRISGIWHFH